MATAKAKPQPKAEPRSAEDLARAIYRQADRKRKNSDSKKAEAA